MRIYLQPVAFILTRPENVQRDAAGEFLPMDGVELQQAPEGSRVVLMVPLVYDGRGLFGMVGYLSPSGSKSGREMLAACLEVGRAMGLSEEEAVEKMLKVMRERTALGDGKDIAGRFIRKLCADTSAEAIVKVDESYWLAMPPGKEREDFPKDLSDCPEASECLMINLETRLAHLWTHIPFVRTKRNLGKVKSFGEPVEHLSAKSENAISGRFTHFIEAPQ